MVRDTYLFTEFVLRGESHASVQSCWLLTVADINHLADQQLFGTRVFFNSVTALTHTMNSQLKTYKMDEQNIFKPHKGMLELTLIMMVNSYLNQFIKTLRGFDCDLQKSK